MAVVKKENESDSLDNEEDIDDEIESDEDEESSEKEGKEGDKSKKGSEEDSTDTSDSDEGDEDSESSEAKKSAEADREAIRERRRREKKMRKERDKREKANMQNLVVSLQQQVRELRDGAGKELYEDIQSLKQDKLEGDMRQLLSIYNDAKLTMQNAIKNNDGEGFVKAKEISDKAWMRYNQLELQRHQRPGTSQASGVASQTREAPQQRSESRADAESSQDNAPSMLTPRGKQMALNWAQKHSAWYNVEGAGRESAVVQAIDLDLYKEGYDPNTKEYWDELDDRVKDTLPHRYQNGQAAQRQRPKQTVGGGGQDGAPSGAAERALPAEFVKTLKAAGYWDDAAKKKAAIRNFYANQKKA